MGEHSYKFRLAMNQTLPKPDKKPAKDAGKAAANAAITSRATDYAQWYIDVVRKAELADHSGVRGCMVIRPNGYAIWEKMQRELDDRFKATGHVNAYFPMFIPLSYLTKEEQHAAGFAKECAVVTHHRLKAIDGEVRVDPEAELEEPLVIRPTSETVIWHQYKKWIESYRDLPLLINQWANVCRWEMRTRLFLRTAEFLWQEGHTAHATEAEAREEVQRMLEVYADFAENVMAVPVIQGHKTPGERFAGAVDTLSIEAMMQDGKALQAGTSHYLGQNFAKSADVQFLNQNGQLEYVYATSWGASTRLVGALIMTHSDDSGLVCPPKLAAIQVVIVPIYRSDAERAQVLPEAQAVRKELLARGISVKVDDRENMNPGAKYYEWELKGIPIRVEIGPKDIEKQSLCVVRRFVLAEPGQDEAALRQKKKQFFPRQEAFDKIPALLAQMQSDLLENARRYRKQKSRVIDTLADYEKFFAGDGTGFAWVHWAGDAAQEEEMAKRFETSVRCIPLESQIPDEARGSGKCILTGKPSAQRVVMAKAY
jgi:prolyl-tRNA synthetase